MKKQYPLLVILILFFSGKSISQNSEEALKLGHWLSKEEMLIKPYIPASFVETAPPTAPVRNIAEFDEMQGALVRYPFGIPISLIKEMAKDVQVTTIVANASQKNTVIQQYVNGGVDTSHCDFLLAPSDSYWTRDYGPWFASDSSNHIGIVDFPYNRSTRPNDDEIPKKVAEMLGIPWYGMKLIHTGGNYMTDGMGISSSTELVWDENPTLTHEQVAQKVKDYLGIDPYLVEPDPNGTYIDHIDCWGKFLAPDKVLIRKVPPTHPQYALIEQVASIYASTPCSYGYNYRVFRVNTPGDQPYTNSVILNNKVLVPFMNSQWDDSAVAAYQTAMPGYAIYGFIGNPSTPWQSTDALHCRVMGVADIGQLYIKHIPLSGNQPAQDNFEITADIIACSNTAILDDSVLIHIKVGNQPYVTKRMTRGVGDHFSVYIPKQPSGTVIRYYLTAADASGRDASCPFIGAADPFSFTSIYTDLTAIPDTLRFETYQDCINGKWTAIKNFTATSLPLNFVEPTGFFTPGPTGWLVETELPTFPYSIAPNDSLPFKVIILIPINASFQGHWIDTLHFETPQGSHNIILLLNDQLVFGGTQDKNGDLVKLNVFPNPMTEKTNLSFELEEKSHVRVEIFDLQGRSVNTLVDQTMPSGAHQFTWDGTMTAGNRVDKGIYIYRVTTYKSTCSGRILVN